MLKGLDSLESIDCVLFLGPEVFALLRSDAMKSFKC